MDFEEFFRKTEAIREQAKTATNVEDKKRLRSEFFDAAIDYFENFTEAIDYYKENLAGDFVDTSVKLEFVGAITTEPRTKNTSYNETPTKGTIMSKTSVTPETSPAPKTSKIAEKLNSLKPSNLADEKRDTVVRRIKLTAAFAAGVLTTVTAVAVKSYYNSFDATDEVQEGDETSESELND
jgi:hypothetical protein